MQSIKTEPLEQDAIIEQRNDTLLTGFGDSDLPEIYRDGSFAKTWKKATWAYTWHRIGEETSALWRDTNVTFENTLQGRARNKAGQAYALDRWTQNEYTERYVSFISLRISPTFNGTYLHPLMQIDVVQDALSDSMDTLYNQLARKRGLDYELVKVLAGTKVFGTCHAHLIIYSDGPVTIEDLRGFCESFVQKCAVLDSQKGNVPSEGAVSIKSEEEIEYRDEYDRDNGFPVAPCTRYLAGNIPSLKSVYDCSEGELLSGAAFHASDRKGFYISRDVSRKNLRREDHPDIRPYSPIPSTDPTDSQEVIAGD